MERVPIILLLILMIILALISKKLFKTTKSIKEQVNNITKMVALQDRLSQK